MDVNKVITMSKGKSTPGTEVYTAPKEVDGKKNAITSVYIAKEAFGGQTPPATVKVTVEI